MMLSSARWSPRSTSATSRSSSTRRPARAANYFILVGHDHVLAHRRLIDPRGLGLSEAKPLPTIKEVGDPVLAHIWDPPVRRPGIERALGSLGHIVEVDGRQWVFVHHELKGYGPDPWVVGQYLPDRGGDQRPRPPDQRRDHRCRHARLRDPAGAADGAAHGALDPDADVGGRGDRAARFRPAGAQALAPARDRRCRAQPREGARRAQMVRRLRAAAAGAPPDGAWRARADLAADHAHGDVHRHRGLHAAGREPAGGRDGGAAKSPFRPARRLHRAGARHHRQVYRRFGHGDLGPRAARRIMPPPPSAPRSRSSG